MMLVSPNTIIVDFVGNKLQVVKELFHCDSVVLKGIM